MWVATAIALALSSAKGPAPARVVPGREAGFCNATTCDECVRCANDGVDYGRGCMWCYSGKRSEHVCFNFYSDGGSTFCEQFAALNQCDRAGETIHTNESESRAPEWLPLVGAVGACVVLALGIGLWATRAPFLAALTAGHAPRHEPSESHAHHADDAPAEASEVEAGLGPSEGGDTPAAEMCVVCLQHARTRMLYPCGHHVCCEACAQRLLRLPNVRCPVCRKPVRDAVRVFG